MMRQKSLGCALIGPGNFGRNLAGGLLRNGRARLVGVLGVTPAESAAGAADLGGRAYNDLAALLNDKDVEAVLIATPSSTHADLAVQAAGAGKHIFCEKPMALTVAECESMIAAARQAGVVLMIGQVQRFVPLLVEVRRLVQVGTLGRPVAASLRWHDLLQRRPGSWYQNRGQVGSMLHQNGVHEIDWWRTVLGEVAEVFARPAPATIQAGLDFPDAVIASLRFENGCIGQLSACMTTYVQQHDGTIQGTNGSLSFSLTDGTLQWRDRLGAGESRHQEDFPIKVGSRGAMEIELGGFLEAVLDGKPVPVSGEEGRANIEVIQAAMISMVEHRPVTLPLPQNQWDRRAYLEV